MKITVTPTLAAVIRAKKSNCGSSFSSLEKSGMASYARALRARAKMPVEAFLHHEVEIGKRKKFTFVPASKGGDFSDIQEGRAAALFELGFSIKGAHKWADHVTIEGF